MLVIHVHSSRRYQELLCLFYLLLMLLGLSGLSGSYGWLWGLLVLLAWGWHSRQQRLGRWTLQWPPEGPCRIDGVEYVMSARSRVMYGCCLLCLQGRRDHWRLVWYDSVDDKSQFRALARRIHLANRASFKVQE